jgi:hypothetical protein
MIPANCIKDDTCQEPWISRHARERMQQRCIPSLIVLWLLAFGNRQHLSGHKEIYYLDKKARLRLRQYAGSLPLKRMSDLLDAYLVMRDGVVITVGHRYQKVIRTS